MYRYLNILLKRQKSTCSSKFSPLIENYKTMRHIHFPGITPFAKGQEFQQNMVNANLDFKKMESKIRKQQKEIADLGHILNQYEQDFIQKVLSMKPFPTLLTFEFENVYTGGKQMKQDPQMQEKIKAYEKLGCSYYQLERGGQVTWHGKGQLTAYLIMDLKQFSNLTVRCFVDSVLLKGVQNLLKKNYNLDSYVNENPGVWMQPNDKKISSVGCNIQRAITSYGIGLNVNPDLKFLNTYTMCGLPDATATSLEELRPGKAESIKVVGEQFAKEVAKLLNILKIEHMDGSDFMKPEKTEQL